MRLGRVLGAGARAAARTAVSAVDAATAPNPVPTRQQARSTPSTMGARSVSASHAPAGGPAARPPAAITRTTTAGLKQGAKRFGREVWNPFVRLSGVLWLEVTGVFFGIFSLFAFGAAWRLRWAWKPTTANTVDHGRLLGAIVMCAVFGYFCISSFVRAKRRERGH